ncbi:MAG: hypothetical protein PSN35_00740 [Candidatus Thioglobus sp.]|uniref:hypothetical protein n=1 Tax=Candidatus Thioglobus sp. TaxID=2026721 RepID=UPI0019C69A98|nr:hypothetical protein [Candidatus Thioglobus sp.]MBC8551249.1 hypothetical protein [Candidatus Brocadiales bacterium]MBL6985045.1 hypothetical protein [Candidatus Thioglobus sp.]MBL7003746.1 hypothetical protein [Gammaproteobacteria bacterium]MDC9726344.1 hypothetical protein [Candidatus Thioglobus sp.]
MNYHLIHKDSISTVLEKARQYRSLREPDLAISICIDVFAVDPENQEALVIYILALTDQYSHQHVKVQPKKIIETIARLTSEFHQIYYTGIFLERKARALLRNPMSQSFAYEGLMEAIVKYEAAEKMAPSHCSDPILRYNSCLRTIEKEHLKPREEFDELY